MKLKAVVLCVLWSVAGHVFAEQRPAVDPLTESLFAPELVMQHQSEIAFTVDQRNALTDRIEKARTRLGELQQRLEREVEDLAALVKKDRVDEQAVLDELDKVLNQERELKRAHMKLVVGIKNNLTSEQQAKLREIRSKIAAGQIRSPEEVQRVLEGKLQKVQTGVQDWQNAGRDPGTVAEIMQEFEPLTKAGRHNEAEGVLDRALKLLQQVEKDQK